jgi:hypothetical protein
MAAPLLPAIEQADRHHEPQQDPGLLRFADQAIDQRTGQQQQVGGL